MTLPYAVSHVANLVCPLTNERLEDPVVFYNCVHDNQGAMSRAAVLEKFKASEEEIPYICPFILCQHDARNNRPDVHTLPWLCNSCGQDKRRKVTCAVCHLVKSHPTDLVEAPALAHYLSSTPVSVLSVDVLEDDRYRVTGTEFPIYRAAPIGEPARKKYDFADEGKNKDRFISHTEEEEGPGFRVVPAQVIAKPILKRKRRSWEPETGDLAAAATSSGSAAAWGGDDASDLENRPWKSPKLSEAFVATTTTVQVTQVFRLVREGVPLSKQRPPEPPRTVVIRPDTKRHPGRRIGFRFTSEEAARHQARDMELAEALQQAMDGHRRVSHTRIKRPEKYVDYLRDSIRAFVSSGRSEDGDELAPLHRLQLKRLEKAESSPEDSDDSDSRDAFVILKELKKTTKRQERDVSKSMARSADLIAKLAIQKAEEEMGVRRRGGVKLEAVQEDEFDVDRE